MRRLGLLALAAGLVLSVLPVAPTTVGAQTTITLSFVDGSGNAVTSAGEDSGIMTVRLKASVATAPTSSLRVRFGNTAGTATGGALRNERALDPWRPPLWVCPSGDYCFQDDPLSVDIPANSTTGMSSNFKIWLLSDKVTEAHETIIVPGTASGYTVNSATFTINDQDRTLKVNTDFSVVYESGTNAFVTETYEHLYRPNPRVVVGGVTNNVFIPSTSSTFGSALSNMRMKTVGGTASYFEHAQVLTQSIANTYDVTGSHNENANDPTHTTIAANSITSGAFSGVHGPATPTLGISRDQIVEADEIFYLRVDAPSGWTAFRTPITVKDANRAMSLTVDTDSEEDGSQNVIAEGASGSGVSVSASFSNAMSSQIASATTVTLLPSVETPAGAGKATTTDFTYTPSTPNTIVFPARSVTQSAAGSLAGLSVTDDAVVEGPETFLVGGSSALGTAQASTLTIYDNDADIELEVSPSSVEEQAAAQQVTVTARFKGTSSILTSATSVAVTVAGSGGAALGSTCPSTGVDACTNLTNNQMTISIPARGTSGSGTFMVTVPNDSTSESGEALSVSGSASVGGSAVMVESASLPIVDGGVRVDLSLHETDSGETALSEITEGGEERTVRVKATAATAVGSDTTISVTVGATGGTATAGVCSGSGQSRSCSSGDYDRGAETVDVTISSGDTSGTADVTINPLSDTVAEGEETIRFVAGVGHGRGRFHRSGYAGNGFHPRR